MSIAFVLGNGKSRAPIPLEPLKKYGTIYACNAVYRDFSPDYLVAVDVKMVNEINMKRYQMDNQVWTNYNKSFESFTGFHYFEPSLGWSSGPSALSLCSTHNHKAIYILGFDFQGIGNEKRRVNNNNTLISIANNSNSFKFYAFISEYWFSANNSFCFF